MNNPIKLYEAVFISRAYNCSIFQLKDGKVFRSDEHEIIELPYTKIVDEYKDMIRIYNDTNSIKKWGVLHINGREIVPPIYDYISPLLADRFFRVFIGDYYKGTLGQGKWGMLNLQNEIIVPIEYEWLELVDDRTVLCNVGGSPLIKWFDGEEKKDVLSLADGLWKMISLDSLKIKTELGSYHEVKEMFAKEYPKHFFYPVPFEYQSYEWQKNS